MPVKEPEDRRSPQGTCERAVNQIARASLVRLDATRDVAMSTRQVLSMPFMQASMWIRKLGPAGSDLADDMEGIATFGDLMRGQWALGLEDADQFPVKIQEEAYEVLWSGKGKVRLSDEELKVHDILEPSFKDSMALAKLYEWTRYVEGMGFVPIKGSGRQAPTILSKDGRAVVAEAKHHDSAGDDTKRAAVWVTMENHPEISKGLKMFSPEERAQIEQAALGHIDEETMSANVIAAGKAVAEEVGWGFRRLEMLHDDQVRGIVGYLERERLLLPQWMRERNPQKALPGHYGKISLMLSASRTWGSDFDILISHIGRIRVENGDAAANVVGEYIFPQLGKPMGTDFPVMRRAASAISTYEMLRLFGGTFIGPLRNMGQTFTNAVDTPIVAIYRSYREMPPFMRQPTKLANDLYRKAIQSGATTPHTPTTEFVSEAVQKGAMIHVKVIKRNQVRSAVQGFYAMLENMNRVMDMQGEKGPITSFLSKLRHLQTDPEAAHTRALERAGMPAEKIEAAKKFGEVSSKDEISDYIKNLEASLRKEADVDAADMERLLKVPESELTQTDMLRAMQLTSKNQQFGYDFANKRIKNSVFWRSIMMVKGWGTRMGGYIYRDVMGELWQGNAKPLVKLMAATFALGELYNWTRDQLTGQEKSMISRLGSGALRDEDGWDETAIALTIIRNIGDGGGLFLLMDVMYGWQSLVGGPIGGTATNMLRAGQHILENPSKMQATAALADFIDKELILTKQWAGAFLRMKSLFEGKKARLFKYNTWRSRSFRYLDQRDDPTAWDAAMGLAQRFLQHPRNDPTPRSLTYEDASSAITNNNVKAAAKDMANLLRSAKDYDERESIIAGMRVAGRQRSPLGVVSEEDRAEFLGVFSDTDYSEAQDLQFEWMADWREAMYQAEGQTTGQYRDGGN